MINKLFVFSSRNRLIKSQVQKIYEGAQFLKIKSNPTEKIYSSGGLLCVRETLFCKGLLVLVRGRFLVITYYGTEDYETVDL